MEFRFLALTKLFSFKLQRGPPFRKSQVRELHLTFFLQLSDITLAQTWTGKIASNAGLRFFGILEGNTL